MFRRVLKARMVLMSIFRFRYVNLATRNGATRLVPSSLSMLNFMEQILSCLIMSPPRVTSTNIDPERKASGFGNTFSAFMIHS